MDKLALGLRYLLAVIFIVFGANKLAPFIPMPPPAGDLLTMFGGFMAMKYFLPLLAVTEIAVGLALLVGRYQALALIILAPVTLNILLVHVFIGPEGLPMGIFVFAANWFLMYHHRASYQALLQSK